jgi:outer membrane protein assembly factor BamB
VKLNKLVFTLLPLALVLPALILFTFTGPVTADSTATSWPSWRGDSRNTGCTPSSAPNTNMTSWKIGPLPYTPYVSGLVVANGKVFVDLSEGYVKALDEATGVELWEADLVNAGTVPYGICVAGEVVVGGGFAGDLYGLNETTGELLWHVDPPEPGWFLLAPTYDPVTGDVYINTFQPNVRGYIYRINPENGSTVWATQLSPPGQWPYWGGVTTPAVDPANGRVFVLAYGYPPANPTYKTAVFAFNITDGQKLWGPVVISQVSSSLCSPSVADGKVFVGDNTGQFFALDEFNGSIVWGPVFLGWSPSPSPGRGVTSAAVDEAKGVVAVATANQTLYSLNMHTGEVNWKVKLDGVPGSTAPAVSGDGKIVIACAGNYSAEGPEKISVYNETTGELIWSYVTGATGMEASQSPAIADDSIFYSDYNGYVYRFYNVSVVHDIGVLNVSVAPSAVHPGGNVSVNVTVGNHGNYTETFNVTIYYGGYALQ